MDTKYQYEAIEAPTSPDRDEISDSDVMFDDSPPPAYHAVFTNEQSELPEYASERPVSIMHGDTGRFSIDLNAGNRTSAFIQSFSLPAQRPRVIEMPTNSSSSTPNEKAEVESETGLDMKGVALDIVFMLIGSRDEIKSMIFVGQELQKQGNRVLIATHGIFRSFTTKLGMEFFSISNDPQHPIATNDSGFIPGLNSSDRSQVQQSRRMLLHTLKQCWNACRYSELREGNPFSVDAIIATPLAHAHIHCAERLSIPLHIMSTTPWTPTRQFAHPLAQLESGIEIDSQIQNYLSYILVEDSIQHEIHRVVDHFRQAVLGLPTSLCVEEKGLLAQFSIPHTYLWASGLLARPQDWEDHIEIGLDIAGFVRAKSSLHYTPSEKLREFLSQAVEPVLVQLDAAQLKDPEYFVVSLKEASLKYGTYIILPKGFADMNNLPDLPRIFLLDSEPTEWLTSRASVLLTSGSASSINHGIEHCKRIICVPLLQDQLFWSNAVQTAGIGPAPIKETAFSSEIFADSFCHCLRPDVREAAASLGARTKNENGAANAAKSFYRHLQWEKVQRDPTTSDPAIYSMRLKGIVVPSIAKTVVDMENGLTASSPGIESPTVVTRGGQAVCVDTDKSTFFVGAMDVGQNLIKAIIKPTISHISDTRTRKKNLNDLPTKPMAQKPEKSKSGFALKVARNVGFGSAVACGKIAILPFKTVYYMGETASYGIRALQKLDSPGHEAREEQREGDSYFNTSARQGSLEGCDTDLHLSLQQDDAYSRALRASSSNTQIQSRDPNSKSDAKEFEGHF
ncbi:hypothetical protein N7478_012437 [Penicillium angulare]|uniref:uncharacterized protein n=1 Tax=Penicillium angulare TaxID=116970 RepID=UPI0025417B8F|nr:uncharacterized protein N7478_012437 [Penicillium angulare]KAJ5259456.1 hypothetical protein N7478_012437 [Penicillium angulare]